jgi:hypothetical protein
MDLSLSNSLDDGSNHSIPAIHSLPCIQTLFAMSLDSLAMSFYNDGGHCCSTSQLNWLTRFVLKPHEHDVDHTRGGSLIIQVETKMYEFECWSDLKGRDLACWTLEDSEWSVTYHVCNCSAYAEYRSKRSS